MLRGRAGETTRIDQLLSTARSARGSVLVLRGDPGIGKSALLEHAATRASDFRILRSAGIEAESELPYAGLHLLLGRETERIDTLPERQAQALAGALGLGPTAPGDVFLTGLAVLTLLADIAEERPLLCLVDDAQWLDQATADALLFAARRLEAESVALLLAVREPHAPALATPGLAELRLEGLSEPDAWALLADQPGELTPQDHKNVLAEAQGNPLALVELSAAHRDRLPQATSSASVSLQSRLQHTFAKRICALPEATRKLVLVASLEETGDAATVLRTAEVLGLDFADFQPAEQQQLLRFEAGRVVFGHPMIRSTAYQQAPLAPRIAVHRALAEVLGAQHPDRRAWHLAAAATGPDDEIAAALVRTAEEALRRGGNGAVAAASAKAAELSTDPGKRAHFLLIAAQAAAEAGQFERSMALLDSASALTDGPQRVFASHVRSRNLENQGRHAEGARALLDVDISVVPPQRRMDSLYVATRLAYFANDAESLRQLATWDDEYRNEETAPLVRTLATALSEASRFSPDGFGAGARAVREFTDLEPIDDLHERIWAAHVPLLVADQATAMERARQVEQECRDRGSLGVLPEALLVLGRTQLYRGRFRETHLAATEGLRIATDAGQTRQRAGLSVLLAELAAIEGDEQRCHELVVETVGQGPLPYTGYAAGVLSLLDLGLGRYEQALERLEQAANAPTVLGLRPYLPIMVEAAVRLGESERAMRPFAYYADWSAHCEQSWVEAIEQRCRALVSTGARVERHFTRALDLHRHSGGSPFEQARTALLYGEWLRRARRVAEARPPLTLALETFERLGAVPWTDRARSELRATGDRRGSGEPASARPLDQLTPQELQCVRLAATGLSNRQIGARLFVSPRTVSYHLYKAYPKLGVSSRVELAGLALGEDGTD